MNQNIRVIRGPLPGVQDLILRRLPKVDQEVLNTKVYNAIALINATIPNIYYYADLAMKAGNVYAAVMQGTCPQHITTLVIFGDVGAVNTAVRSIEADEEEHRKQH